MSFLGKVAFGLAVLAVVPAAAFPTYYQGCSLPTTGLGSHQSPSQDGAINFTVTDSGGDTASQYVAGQTYTVTVAPSASSRGIIITDNGSFSSASGCEDKKVTWNEQLSSQSATWTAPDTDTATLSVNFATGSSAAYKQSSVTLSKSTGSGTGGSVIDIPLQPEAPPPTPAPTPAPTKAATPAPTPAPTKAATPAPTKAATPAPTEAAKATPVPTEAAKATPAPTEAAKATPAPTEAAKVTPAPTEAAKATPAPTEAAATTIAPTPAPTQPVTPAPTPKVTEGFQPGQNDIVKTIQGAATFADLQVEDFTTVVQNKFISKVADIANVDPSFVKILSIAPGSVVVDWAVAVPQDSALSTQELPGLLTQSLEDDPDVTFGDVSISELKVEDKTLDDFEAAAATPSPTDATDPSGADTFGPGRAFAAALLVAVAINAAQAGL